MHGVHIAGRGGTSARNGRQRSVKHEKSTDTQTALALALGTHLLLTHMYTTRAQHSTETTMHARQANVWTRRALLHSKAHVFQPSFGLTCGIIRDQTARGALNAISLLGCKRAHANGTKARRFKQPLAHELIVEWDNPHSTLRRLSASIVSTPDPMQRVCCVPVTHHKIPSLAMCAHLENITSCLPGTQEQTVTGQLQWTIIQA